MSKGYTSYECICGGIASEGWDWYGSDTKCDKCDSPKPKEEDIKEDDINEE